MDQRFLVRHMAPIKILFQSPKKIVITTHHRPDGDAMGSSLGLYNYLIQRNHFVQVITTSDYPQFLKWMPGNDRVITYQTSKDAAEQFISDAEVIFCLDFNRISRLDKMQDKVKQSKAVKILIDHHPDPEESFDHLFSFPDACATCELIYEFIVAMNDQSLINSDVAECLYTGIMTDTNSFRFESMKANTHRIVAKLMEAGALNYKIHELVYDTNSENRMRLLGLCLKDKLVVLPEFKTAYIALSNEEHEQYNYQAGDTEGVVNYALSINKVKLAAFFAQRDNEIKISFRSRGNFFVNALAGKYFEGGGHNYAAGGRSTLPLDETIRKFVNILPEYVNQIT